MGKHGLLQFGNVTAMVALVSCWCFGQTPTPAPAANPSLQNASYSESVPYVPRSLKPDPKSNAKSKPLPLPTPGADTVEVRGPYTLPVFVFDSADRPVVGLTKDNFKVLIAGKEQAITRVEIDTRPLNVVLVLDASPSTSDRIGEIQKIASEIERALRPEDKVMVVQFAKKLTVLSEFTTDRQKIRQRREDGTSLYDSISELCRDKLSAAGGPSSIVLFTDGMDYDSVRTNYPSSLLEVEKCNSTIIPVYFDPGDNMGIKGQNAAIVAGLLANSLPNQKAEYSERRKLGKAYLNDLVLLSGGRAVSYEDRSKGKLSIAAQITSWLTHQYFVTLDLSLRVKPWDRVPIQVRVDHPGLAILAKGSYLKGN